MRLLQKIAIFGFLLGISISSLLNLQMQLDNEERMRILMIETNTVHLETHLLLKLSGFEVYGHQYDRNSNDTGALQGHDRGGAAENGETPEGIDDDGPVI